MEYRLINADNIEIKKKGIFSKERVKIHKKLAIFFQKTT